MSKIRIWLNAIRPRTLPLSVSGVIIGSAIAIEIGAFNYLIFIPAILTTLGLQILSNLANDYGDASKGTDGEDRIGPQRMVQSGMISEKKIKLAILFSGLLSFFSGIWLLTESFEGQLTIQFWAFLVLGILAIWAAIKYTVGKDAYGYKGMGDLFVFIFFGFVSVAGSSFLYLHEFVISAFVQSAVVGLLATGVLHLNNMRDMNADVKTGKITLAVSLGLTRSKQYFTLLLSLAFIMAVYDLVLTDRSIWMYGPLLAFIPVAKVLFQALKTEHHAEFNKFLKPLALSTFLYALLFIFTSAC